MITQDEFIDKCQKIHNNKYNYSKTIYTGTKNKILIICSIHGEFEQVAGNHKSGSGCETCSYIQRANKLRMSFNDFVNRANKIHYNKYTYDEKSYQNIIKQRDKIIIFCKDHGVFAQSREDHLAGNGCQKCKNKKIGDLKRGNTIDFIIRAQKLHFPVVYDYSFVKYIDNKTEVEIICPTHGSFWQTPNSHLVPSGCLQCGIERRAANKTWDNKEFITQANLRHHNKYDYSLVNYIRSDINIVIICPTHGSFEMRPTAHIQQEQGCYKCTARVSNGEISWLKYLNIPHLITSPQYRVWYDEKKYYLLDGYDPLTNTAYEYNGDFIHGNPNYYDKNDINTLTKKTFGEQYQKTLLKEARLKELGYKVVSIWESDWKKMVNMHKKFPWL